MKRSLITAAISLAAGVSAFAQSAASSVQRDANQQERIEAGVRNGSLANHEVSQLEKGQAKVDRKEFVAGRDGQVGAREQARIQHAENHQSKKIHHEKTDADKR